MNKLRRVARLRKKKSEPRTIGEYLSVSTLCRLRSSYPVLLGQRFRRNAIAPVWIGAVHVQPRGQQISGSQIAACIAVLPALTNCGRESASSLADSALKG